MSALLSKLETLRVNPDWAKLPLFDRKGWKRVRFGDVVENINETCDPNEAGLERFIAMEHLEPGSLHIRTWGNVADGTTFTRRCQPGQVLFGKRRAYQRKVAVSEFDAVVSGDIYVFAAKSDRLLPELLPFICISERFFKFAVETSAGSLSPRTNWSHLADFQFDLPPLDQQLRIADILWATDDVRQSTRQLRIDVHALERATGESFFSSPSHNELKRGWLRLTGQLLLEKGYLFALQDGNHGSDYPRSDEFALEGLVYLSATNISDDGRIDFASCPRLPIARANALRIGPARGGDVILTNNATVGRVAIVPLNAGEIVASTSTTYYRPDTSRLNREFLAAYMKSMVFQKQLSRVMVQSTRHQVPITTQKTLTFLIPPIQDQEEIVAKLNKVTDLGRQAENYLHLTIEAQRSFTRKLFEDRG